MTGRSFTASRAALFCACLLAPCLVILVAIPFVARTDWFARGAIFSWVPVRDYPYDVTGADADVVIFGDSSALAGVDPRLMEPRLGVKVVNLSPILKSLSMMEDKPLAAYLRHNKAPRLIVVYVAPWNTGTAPDEASPDGLVVMMRHDSPGHMLEWVARHPVEMLNADIFIGSLTLGRIGKPQTTSSREAASKALGFSPYPGVLPHLEPGCRLGPSYVVPPDAGSWARKIVERYQTPQTRVVLYLAPLPDCTGTAAFVAEQSELRPKPINRLQLLPPQLFLDDTYYAHPEEANVPVISNLLTDAIRPLIP